jgi:hypothetical protein
MAIKENSKWGDEASRRPRHRGAGIKGSDGSWQHLRYLLQWTRTSDGAEMEGQSWGLGKHVLFQWDRASDGAEISFEVPGSARSGASMGPRQ